MLQCMGNLVAHLIILELWIILDIVETLHNYKHVINPNT